MGGGRVFRSPPGDFQDVNVDVHVFDDVVLRRPPPLLFPVPIAGKQVRREATHEFPQLRDGVLRRPPPLLFAEAISVKKVLRRDCVRDQRPESGVTPDLAASPAATG